MVTVTLQGESIADVYAQAFQLLKGYEQITTPSYEVKLPPGLKVDESKLKVATQEKVAEVLDSVPQAAVYTQPAHDEAIAAKPEKRTRRTKAEIEAEKAAKAAPETFTAPAADVGTAQTATAIATEEPKAASKEAVHQALQQVNVAVGLNKAREILAGFKIGRISELKEDQYKPFVEKCNEAVMMHG